jgi:hypothetical protein
VNPADACVRFGYDVTNTVEYLLCLQEEQDEVVATLKSDLDYLGNSTAEITTSLLERIEYLESELADTKKVVIFLLEQNKKLEALVGE